MVQYQATFYVRDTRTGQKLRNETFGFYANDVSQSIVRAESRLQSRNDYFQRVGGRYALHLGGLKVFGAGRIGDSRYDPAADLCDDCNRPFWKGHNPNIDH